MGREEVGEELTVGTRSVVITWQWIRCWHLLCLTKISIQHYVIAAHAPPPLPICTLQSPYMHLQPLSTPPPPYASPTCLCPALLCIHACVQPSSAYMHVSSLPLHTCMCPALLCIHACPALLCIHACVQPSSVYMHVSSPPLHTCMCPALTCMCPALLCIHACVHTCMCPVLLCIHACPALLCIHACVHTCMCPVPSHKHYKALSSLKRWVWFGCGLESKW